MSVWPRQICRLGLFIENGDYLAIVSFNGLGKTTMRRPCWCGTCLRGVDLDL